MHRGGKLKALGFLAGRSFKRSMLYLERTGEETGTLPATEFLGIAAANLRSVTMHNRDSKADSCRLPAHLPIALDGHCPSVYAR
jgi:hypothetical protein